VIRTPHRMASISCGGHTHPKMLVSKQSLVTKERLNMALTRA
jgi:hypothetical protein